MTQLLTDEFVEKYPDFPEHMSELGKFVYYRTYSRWLPEIGRRETWKETCRRATEYNLRLAAKHYEKIGYTVPYASIRAEAESFFDEMFNLRQFLSGRTLWVGGAESGIADKYPLANFNCFGRETEFLTKQGLKTFKDFKDGDKVEVLGANGGWEEATVRNFGKDNLLKITFRKGRQVREVFATANHRWYVNKSGKYRVATTSELSAGDMMREKRRYENTRITPSRIAIMHGMVYGDGTYDKKMGHTRVALCGEKQELLTHFIDGSICSAGKHDQTVVYGLPSSWKELPLITANVEYLYGFIIGLIATDGSVSPSVSVSSSDEESLDWLRSACYICGIRTGEVLKQMRVGFGIEESAVYTLSLDKRDIEINMLLRTKHKESFKRSNRDDKWRVESVAITDRYEDVWCVQEPKTESFVLGNGILTKNCSFINIRSWSDLGDLFYLLMIGTGVGFKCTKEFAAGLSSIRTNTTLINAPYEPVPVDRRLERTKVTELDNGYVKIYVGDSKEGWVEALRAYFEILTETQYELVHTVKISYNSVRPKGERLKRFGGTASGHEPLAEMFAGIDRVLKNQIDPSLAPLANNIPTPFMAPKGYETDYKRVRPIHILDIGNLIGANVVVGGVRRTAEIFLFDADDYECLLAKYGINGVWTEDQLAHHRKVGEMLEAIGQKPKWFDSISKVGDGRFVLDHRRLSNNSIAFETKPSREFLNLVFTIMQSEGEPGFINLEEARRRRPNAEGLNPCAEILLDSYGVCNLTTVNVMQFVRDGKLDIRALLQAQRRSARAALRMTLVTLELPHWNAIQQRDRLLGTSLTGWKDAMAAVNYGERQERDLLELLGVVANNEAESYAKELRVNAPLLVTTVKPEGTISQLAGGVSSGLHWSHSPYYIRRIRVNASDPLVKVAQELGWTVNPEVGTPGGTEAERLTNARTLVIDFPVASGALETKDDVSATRQFETYFRFQRSYTDHNSSNTITVRPDEWATVEQTVWDGWDDFVGVSFLALDGGTYQLAPYEAITKEEYEELRAKMKPFDPAILVKYETDGTSDLEGADSCEGGACPIR